MMTPITILCLLTMPLAIAMAVSRLKGTALNIEKYALWGLGIAFIFFSIGHAAKSIEMAQMLPPWVPARLLLVYVTGLLELVVGIALFSPKYQYHAAQAAIAVLILFFPVNIYSAMNHIGLGGHQWGAIYLLVRAPLQGILIAWAYFLCLPENSRH